MKGYHIKLKGLNLDRLIEKINRQNIVVYELKRPSHNELSFEINNNSLKKITPIIEPYEREIKPLALNFFKKFVCSNLAVLLALPLCFIMFYFSSNLVWKIEISGVDKTKKQELISILDSYGVSENKKISLNATEIENLLLKNDYIAQVSCYYKGSTLFINISEKLVYVKENYQPIVAKYNGIILDCHLTRGTINFVVGEYVSKGDILVYPYIMDKFGNQIPVDPVAEIKAKCFISETNIIPRKENILVRTGKSKTYYDISFNKKYLIKTRKPFVFFETVVYNNYISSVLPFIRQQSVYFELSLQERVNDLESLIGSNEEVVRTKLYENTPVGAELLDEKVTSMIIDDCLYSTAFISCFSTIS